MSKNLTLPNYQPCPWCNENNNLGDDLLPVICSRCGHRADVRQMQCDCHECLALTDQEYKQRRASFSLISNHRNPVPESQNDPAFRHRPKPVPVPSEQERADRMARIKAEVKAEVEDWWEQLNSERSNA